MSHTKLIACATVVEEMLPYMPPGMSYETLDFGLHRDPDHLRSVLQEAIDATGPDVDTLILGYGLCSNAVVGLCANGHTLVIPRLDDCIALFIGSCATYRRQTRREPGTYYLTKGWIEVGDSPFEEYVRWVEQYGKERADRVFTLMFKHYTRLAFITTGQRDQEHYRAYARQTAQRFGLLYEEIPGSPELIKKTLYGPWEEDFVVVPAGQTVTLDDFAPLVFGVGRPK